MYKNYNVIWIVIQKHLVSNKKERHYFWIILTDYLPLDVNLSSQCGGSGKCDALVLLIGGSLGARTSPAGPTTANGEPSPAAEAGSPLVLSLDNRDTITWPRTPQAFPRFSSHSSKHWSKNNVFIAKRNARQSTQVLTN